METTNQSLFQNITNRTESEPETLFVEIVGPVAIAIFIFSVTGNTLVIVTLVQNKRMRTVTNVFLLNLACSDLLLAVFCMPFTLIPQIMRNFIFGATMCVMIRYLQGISVGVSCFTLVAISLERYFAICQPLHSRKWQTLSHAYKITVIVWLLASFVMVPIAVFTTHSKLKSGIHVCREEWTTLKLEQAYTLFLNLCLLLIPVLIMSVAYGFVVSTLWIGIHITEKENGGTNKRSGSLQSLEMSTLKLPTYGTSASPGETTNSSAESTPQRRLDQRRVIRHSNPEKSRSAKLKVIRMLFVVVLEFFVCMTPLYAIQTWKTFHYQSAVENLTDISYSLIYILAYLSSACNPITYCFMNKQFRQSFFQLLGCCRPRRQRQFSSRSEPMTSVRIHGTRLSSLKNGNHDKLTDDVMQPERRHLVVHGSFDGTAL